MATDLNTLKNWFKAGLKPTQTQFWAWLDSFWHKDEKIPMDSIEGIDTVLENKAEISSVEVKANADASGLSDDEKQAWKQALNVGELPSNIATVDEGEKVGNTYDKTEINILLEDKLDLPQVTDSTENFPFVVGVNEENESVKLPAGDLGKNIGNTDMKVPEGVARILDVTGAKMQFKGLNNKKNDASFGRKLISNEQGELAYSDETDVTINIPDEFTGSTSIGTITININHIYPNQIPQIPTYVEEIQQIMANYKNIVFNPITQQDINIITAGNLGLNLNKVNLDGSFSLDGNMTLFKDYANTETVVNATASVALPNDKNWILKITGSISAAYNGGGIWAGVSRGVDESVAYGLETTNYSSLTPMGANLMIGRENFLCLIIKAGNIITVCVYQKGKSIFYSYNAFTELGNYIPKFHLLKGTSAVCKMSYKILD